MPAGLGLEDSESGGPLGPLVDPPSLEFRPEAKMKHNTKCYSSLMIRVVSKENKPVSDYT